MKAFPKFGPETIEQLNRISAEKSNLEFLDFKDSFVKGVCYLCGKRLDHFDESAPCMHWLLKPTGLKKKHIFLILRKFDYQKIQPFLRWIANTEKAFGNINDLVEEKSSKKVIENTITFKNLEWSFSASENDFKGISDSKAGAVPHYHFQMRVNGLPYVDYSDYHIPFTKYDLWVFDIQNDKFEDLKFRSGRGMGMQGILNEVPKDKLLDAMKSTTNVENATFSLSSMVTADPETSGISGDELSKIFKEHKKTGIPIAKLLRRLKNVTITTIIQPGEGVPTIAARRGGRGKGLKVN